VSKEDAPRPRAGEAPVTRYILFRLVLCGGLFGLALATVASQPWAMFTLQALFNVAAVTFLFLGLSTAAVRRFGDASWFRWSQLLFDTALVTTLVWLSDGPQSPYFVLFFMNIVGAAWFLPPWGAVVVAAVNASAFAVTTAAGVLGWTLWLPPESGALLYTELVLRIFALFLVGMLSALLAEKLRSARRELQETLRAVDTLAERHGAVLNELETGILIIDEEGNIRSQNPAGVGILGHVMGQRLDRVLSPTSQQWEQVYDSGEEVTSLICRRSDLGFGGSIIVVEDVTELRRMEEVVEREERLAAVGRLAAGLAHEIRNPLASLSGSVQLMQEEGGTPLHQIVLREVEHLNYLVQDFLDTARPLQLRKVPTNVVTIVRDVVTSFSQDPRYQDQCEVKVELAELPNIVLDGSRFRQVLWNLLLNAAQATLDYGRIDVIVGYDDNALVVRVQDEGVGIPRDRLERIFDPFYTTRTGGTGLGLANVERIVRTHGGTMSVSSTVGKGTCFTLYFPAGSSVQERSSESLTSEATSNHGG
jgi:two-component system sensor histidine kinase PilS (NtrC family)